MYNQKICIKLSSGSFKQYLTISLAKLLILSLLSTFEY